MTDQVRSMLSTLRTRIGGYAHRCLRLDSRTLAVFRISLGTLLLVDILLRARNFQFFYTDEGPVTQAVVDQYVTGWTFFQYTQSTTAIAILFVLSALVSLQLIVGYRTRIATILALIVAISFDAHNPFITSYADTLYRLLLFWAIFLPLGERWSLDAVHRDASPREYFVGWASGLVMVQMVIMYFVNGIHKTQSDIWQNGEAAVLVFGLDDMTFLLAGFLRNFPTLLQAGGFLWFVMMLASPLLLLTNGRIRMLLATLYVGGHFSFALTVRIGAFSFVGMTGAFLFMQAVLWNDLRWVTSRIGLYEWYETTRRRLGRAGRRIPYPRVDDDRVDRMGFFGYNLAIYTVVIVIGVCLVVLLPHAGLLVSDDPDREQHFDQILEDSTVTGGVHSTAETFNLNQPEWSIFAPHPRTTDRYYVFAGQTESGETYDIYNDRPLTYDRPYESLHNQYDTYRYRFFMNSIRRGGTDGTITTSYARYLCENWESEDGERLTHINMYTVYENYDRETFDEPAERDLRSSLIHKRGCGDNATAEIDPPPF